jgi:hypothetical protein
MQLLQPLSLYGVRFVWRLIDFNLNSIQDLFYTRPTQTRIKHAWQFLLWTTEHQM